MVERKDQNIIEKVSSWFKSRVVFERSTLGIDFDIVFGEEFSVEDWQTAIESWDNEKRLVYSYQARSAFDRTPEERTKLIQKLSKATILAVGKNAQHHVDTIRRIRRAEIQFNSLSDTNLMNMLKAFGNYGISGREFDKK